VVFSVPPGNCRDSTLKLGHRFLPNPFHFIIIHLSPYHHLVAEKRHKINNQPMSSTFLNNEVTVLLNNQEQMKTDRDEKVLQAGRRVRNVAACRIGLTIE
jgi:hypothetical protein